MCGICGLFDSKLLGRIDNSVLNRMTERLRHRGPDEMESYLSNHVGFGFTRLSIVDLKGGKQPLLNEDGTIILICNGEIFNYKELRKELELKGHTFRSNTDIEVIVHLYEEYGTAFVHRLNGQFAFAIFDTNKNTLFCARDHVGIAPFFYTIVDGIFIFGSEIKAILEHPAVVREVELTGLDQILTFPGMISPHTMFKHIYSLKNGNWLLLKANGECKIKEYWNLEYPQLNELEYIEDDSYYIETLDDLITKSVHRRLMADVPIGFYISGGLDSSIIASKINSINPSMRRHSFSIDFEEKGYSESKYQRLMAQHINSIHHESLFKVSDISKRLEMAVYHSESALKETYNTSSLVLSEAVKKQNIKVILSGEGADELFAGYVGYKFDKMRQANTSPLNEEALLENEMRRKIWGDEHFVYEKKYHSYRQDKLDLYSEEVRSMYEQIDCLNAAIIDKDLMRNRDLVHKRSLVDFKLRLPEHLLADHGDRMAFANSVEARYPFLDKDVIDFARMIPPHLKLRNFNEKYILKKIAERAVPSEIINRPKFAFVAPGSPEILKENLEFINDTLSYETIKKQGYFNPDKVEALRKQYLSDNFKLNLPFDSDVLITVITFGIFLEKFKMNNLK